MLKEKIQTHLAFGLIVAVFCLGLVAILYAGQTGSRVRSAAEVKMASATTYYVDASTGVDVTSRNGLGTATAWKTIKYALGKVQAGDTIMVMPGNYTTEGKITIAISGASGATTTLRSYTAADPNRGIMPDVFVYGFILGSNKYLSINGFDISEPITSAAAANWDTDWNGPGIMMNSTQNIEVRNNYIHDTFQSGVRVVEWQGSGTSLNNQIINNKIYKAGGWTGVMVEDGSGAIVENNDISRSIQNPLYDPLNPTSTLSALNGPDHGSDADGIKVQGNNHTIRGNYIHDIYLSDLGNKNPVYANLPHIDGISTYGPATNLLIENNRIELTCETTTNPTDHKIYYFKQGAMLSSSNGANTGMIVKNNIISACRGLNLNTQGSSNPLSTIGVYNNTFHDLVKESLDIEGASDITVKNNIYYKSGNNINSGTNIISSNNTTTDPKFVNPSTGSNVTGGNYYLSTSSPLINAGINIAGVAKDIVGTDRPQGSSTDIGAYEYVGATCVESWTCGAWGVCSGGSQTRSCVDSDNCGTIVSRPTLTQACVCTPNWSCTNWTNCSAGSQTRVCTDANSCGVNTDKPATTQTCTVAPVCGNGIIEGTEQCDASNLNSQTCVSKGFASGTLKCNSACAFDTSSCVSICKNTCTGYYSYAGRKYYYTSCLTAGRCCTQYKNILGATVTKCK